MSRMSAIYIARKTAKYEQRSLFLFFQILMEMGGKNFVLTFFYLTFDEIRCFNVYFQDFVQRILLFFVIIY